MTSRPPWRSIRSGLCSVSAMVGRLPLSVWRGPVMSLDLPQRLAHGVADQRFLVLRRLLQGLPGFRSPDLAQRHGGAGAGLRIFLALEEPSLAVEHGSQLVDAVST